MNKTDFPYKQSNILEKQHKDFANIEDEVQQISEIYVKKIIFDNILNS